MNKIIHRRLSEHINVLDSVLDLGCGNKDYSSISVNTTTVDAWENVNPDILLDFEEEPLPFQDGQFDHILLIDVIEHLEKDAGKDLIEHCKLIATKNIFLFTPLFWTTNEKNVKDPNCWAYGNKYDYHKSLWNVAEDFPGWITMNIIGSAKQPQWLGYWQV